MDNIRINKLLSELGICSRRKADSLIKEGRVKIEDKVAVLGDTVAEGQRVYVDNRPVGDTSAISKIKPVLLAVYKPRGIVCTTTDNDRATNIVELINYPSRIYPIGRLDKESEGLILMTNQGDLVNKILKASNYHEKEYVVKVDKPIDESFLEHMRRGVYLSELKVKTRKCSIYKKNKNTFNIILTQGLNRQIRRMCNELGYDVTELKRIRIMNIKLDNLKSGEYRSLGSKEIEKLRGEHG